MRLGLIVLVLAILVNKAHFLGRSWQRRARRSVCTSKINSERGQCVAGRKCPKIFQYFQQGYDLKDLQCPKTHLLCCPHEPASLRHGSTDVTTPTNQILGCGKAWYPNSNIDLREYYKGNKTAEEFRRQGFFITNKIVHRDLLTSFTISNSTYSKTFPFRDPNINYVTGGKDAQRKLATYMALLGEEDGSKISWFCGGVLINWQWVLTAAHCMRKTPQYIRLGEYDLGTTTPSHDEDPQDYEMETYIIHPDYRSPGSDHDLALIKLSKPTLISRPDINPICLPWRSKSSKSLVGENVVLTGWGVTKYRGTQAPILQEATIKIFPTFVCDNAYKKLSRYSRKFPNGIKSGIHMCAGQLKGSVDACQGDSGGPIVHHEQNGDKYVLAGIVSNGHGCGKEGFPGIYVPIANPKYLSWIKKIAFN